MMIPSKKKVKFTAHILDQTSTKHFTVYCQCRGSAAVPDEPNQDIQELMIVKLTKLFLKAITGHFK